MIVDGLKTAGLFVCGSIIVGLMVLFVGLAAAIYISYGENSWEVIKALL